MSKTQNQTGLSRRLLRAQFPFDFTLGSALVALALLMTSARAWGDEADDQYMQVYGLIQQADSLDASGKTDAALTQYREAQKALQAFQHGFPEWNSRVVSFRNSYLSEKIAALEDKVLNPPSSIAGAGKSGTNAAAPVTGTQVRLLDAGAEPRAALRLHPQEGDQQTLTMTLKIGFEMKMGQMEQKGNAPPIKFTMTSTAKSVSPEGDISYEMVMGDVTVPGKEAATESAALSAMKAALGSIKGLSFTGKLSPRRLNKGDEDSAPSASNPQAGQMLNQIKDSISTFSFALPEEPVGPGAKWEVKKPDKTEGMSVTQTSTYELVSVEGDRCTVKLTIAESAANQKIQSPVMPNVKVDVSKMTANGTGEMTFDLTHLLPSAGHIDFHYEIHASVNMGGKPQAMTTKNDMDLRLESK